MLWQWHDLLAALNLSEPKEGRAVTGVSIDTRTLVAGDLFVALSGSLTWKASHCSASNWTKFGINENQAAELPDGSLLMEVRSTPVHLFCRHA